MTRAAVPKLSGQIEDYGLVSFVPMNILEEDSVELVLAHIDNAMQFGEEAEPKEPADLGEGETGGELDADQE